MEPEPRTLELTIYPDELPNIARIPNLRAFLIDVLRTLDRFMVVDQNSGAGLSDPQQKFFEGLAQKTYGLLEQRTGEVIDAVVSAAGRAPDTQMRYLESVVKSGFTDATSELRDKLCDTLEKVRVSGDGVQALQADVSTIANAMKVSTTKGRAAEHFIEEALRSCLPDDLSVESTSARNHEADLLVTSTSGQRIIVESKFYTAPVKSTEVDKFHRDLDRTNSKYGILVSLSSGIANKRRFQYDVSRGSSGSIRHLVYISHCGDSIYGLLYGVLFLKQVHALEAKTSGATLNLDLLERKCQAVLDASQQFASAFDAVSSVRYDIFRMREEVGAAIDRVYKTSLDAECRLKATVERINGSIREHLSDMCDVEDDGSGTQDSDAILQTLVENNEPMAPLLSKVVIVGEEYGISIRGSSTKGGKIFLRRGGAPFAEVKILKKRVDIFIIALRANVEVTDKALDTLRVMFDAACSSGGRLDPPGTPQQMLSIAV